MTVQLGKLMTVLHRNNKNLKKRIQKKEFKKKEFKKKELKEDYVATRVEDEIASIVLCLHEIAKSKLEFKVAEMTFGSHFEHLSTFKIQKLKM